jgi:predicted DNA-binding protein YlxM (UPF0122 family)
MGAYYAQDVKRHKVYLYDEESGKCIYKGAYSSKEEALKIVDELNKEWEQKFNIDVEAWARMHIEDLSTITEIADKYNVPKALVKTKLKDYKTEWYDYEEARKKRNRQAVKKCTKPSINDELTASVINTFIKTYISLGMTEAQAWQELHKIIGEDIDE